MARRRKGKKRARQPRPVMDRAVYLVARAVSSAVSIFDPDDSAEFASLLARGLAAVDKKHLNRAKDNLRLAFPDWDEQRTDRVARQTFEHLVQLAFEAMQAPHVVTPSTWQQRMDTQGLGPGLKVLSSGRPSILVTGHLGNWEVMGFALGLLGFPLAAVARPLDNPYVNNWVVDVRQRRGLEVVNKGGAVERMQQIIEQGGSVAFIADQNAGDRGLFVPFFGRLASHYKSIGMLAMQNRCPVLCGYAWRLGRRFHFDLGVQDIIEPEEWESQPDPLLYITARYSRAIEAMIRPHPEQYFWMHRRWKSRPRHEKQGKPFPARMREQLLTLPWLDEAEVDRLAADSESLSEATRQGS
ncbi:lysophospholipid acyltransferase family protein [Mucisphaera calidilacus]|uniref:Lipid A biosynthesis (KDO)2-(Lauroyl)-lipid IVA acyltransferase n=1 Tax=Mucisphaera calidilacus TaxID=2527982 RepID=A0A518BXE6_9BACT|nr:lysophospholipid acyltransferase family protein [Mucisphaera calidilacus]QDU71628.1 Lipid A biosynthesis (KDO)2-(lauroyl)-lipid IVA acyltransferase [Mucisphaera calidilacus]